MRRHDCKIRSWGLSQGGAFLCIKISYNSGRFRCQHSHIRAAQKWRCARDKVEQTLPTALDLTSLVCQSLSSLQIFELHLYLKGLNPERTRC